MGNTVYPMHGLMRARLGRLLACIALSLSTLEAGAQPVEVQLSDLKEEMRRLDVQQQQILNALDEIKRAIAAGANTEPALAPSAVDSITSVVGEDFLGKTAARVAIIEYGDFECSFCREFHKETWPKIRAAYIETGKVRFYFRDLPLPMHARAMPAARAARCSTEQGQYWQMYDALFSDGVAPSLDLAEIRARAVNLGLNVARLNVCIDGERVRDLVRRSVEDAHALGIRGTPTFLIGLVDATGRFISVKRRLAGAKQFDVFEATLDGLLRADGRGQAAGE